MTYVYLFAAIILEVIATSSLKASEGFTRLGPSLIVILGYALAFYLLSLTLANLPVGIAYAIWSGLGIVLVTLVAAILYRQIPDLPATLGMSLIVAGVIVIRLFSKSANGE